MRMKIRIEDALFNLKMWWQRKTRGWSDVEVWNLDDTVSKWIVPRLKAFRAGTIGYPPEMQFSDWQIEIGEMIFGFEFDGPEWYKKNVFPIKDPDAKNAKIKEYIDLCKRAEDGRILFAKRFNHLWW